MSWKYFLTFVLLRVEGVLACVYSTRLGVSLTDSRGSFSQQTATRLLSSEGRPSTAVADIGFSTSNAIASEACVSGRKEAPKFQCGKVVLVVPRKYREARDPNRESLDAIGAIPISTYSMNGAGSYRELLVSSFGVSLDSLMRSPSSLKLTSRRSHSVSCQLHSQHHSSAKKYQGKGISPGSLNVSTTIYGGNM